MGVFVRGSVGLTLAVLTISPDVLAEANGHPLVEIRAGGEVVSSQSRWTHDHSRIVTDSRLRLADGSEVALHQMGGTVDGIGMRVFEAPPVLQKGDRVDVHADRPADTSDGRAWTVREVTYRQLKSDPDAAGSNSSLRYVHTVNKFGAPLYWSSGCVFIVYDAAGTSHLAGDVEFGIMNGVYARWRADTQSCAYLTFEIQSPEEHEVGYDRRNVIKFRETKWCRPATDDDPEECYDSSAAALTTLFFVEDDSSSRNGEILDADIEFNAINFAISYQGSSLGSASCLSDLANTLTHESGHLMGLEHTCWTGTGTRPVDSDGNLVPSCSGALPAEITDSTMYNFQDCGETKKISPEQDDIDGVCAIYPLAEDPHECKPVGGNNPGCCVVAPWRSDGRSPFGLDAGSALVIGLAALLLAATRQRRRRSRPWPLRRR